MFWCCRFPLICQQCWRTIPLKDDRDGCHDGFLSTLCLALRNMIIVQTLVLRFSEFSSSSSHMPFCCIGFFSSWHETSLCHSNFYGFVNEGHTKRIMMIILILSNITTAQHYKSGANIFENVHNSHKIFRFYCTQIYKVVLWIGLQPVLLKNTTTVNKWYFYH